MIPELVGRLPVISSLHKLDEETLVKVLTQPKNALLKQFMKLFRYDKVYLEFTDEAATEIAKQALKKETGARSLRGVVEKLMTPIMYELSDYEEDAILSITGGMVRGEEPLPKLNREAA